VIFAVFFALGALAHSAEPHWLSHDFAVVEAPANWQPAGKFFHLVSDERAQCEAHLREALCVNNETMETLASKWSKVPCDADSADYLPVAMEIYDEMPARIRPLFCSLEKLFL
jgi:hypothetical protein